MLKLSSRDYKDAYILVKGTISVGNTAVTPAATNNETKKVILKNCAPFTNCISKISNNRVDSTEDQVL